MELKKKKINKIIVLIIGCLIILSLLIINVINNQQRTGKIYFNKPVSWEQAYAYLYDNNGDEPLGKWPGTKLTNEEDYIYFFNVTTLTKNNITNYNIIFNDGEQFAIKANCEGYRKIYNLTSGIGEEYTQNEGEWLDYSEDIKIGKIPTTQENIKNVIYMIGDGMGQNHIIAGEIYKGEKLYIQNIENKSLVKTASLSTVTDSAAAATALATGYKTTNGMIGKDKNGANVQNLIEYANTNNMKTGIICTQILNHATPAGFSVHNTYRYNYEEIAKSQVKSCVDLMLGGGRKYFRVYEKQMLENNCRWINELSELKSIQDQRVIGTFAEESISKEKNSPSLADLTKEAINKLENENGFFLMIEGSDIDTYSHSGNMEKMLIEMIDFDNAVGISMEYVDKHPDTLLIVTADHETGGLKLDNISAREQLTDSLFTSNGSHTETDVAIYAYGLGAKDITKYDIIDNTSIYKFVRQAIEN